MYIGGHYHCVNGYKDLLIALDHTRKVGGNVIQIFVGKNIATSIGQKTKISTEEGKDIKKLLKSLNMKIFIHSSLALNFSNPLIGRYHWILDNLIYDMNFAYKIGCKGVVVHLGTKFKDRYMLKKYNNTSVDKEAFSNMVKSLEYVLQYSPKSVKILIETSAGQRNKIATHIEELGKLYHMFNKRFLSGIGFCLDTCHIYSAGYDISSPEGWKNYIKLFNKYIGIKHIYLIHLNDSNTPYNSHTDVHTNLLEGYLFKKDKKTLKVIIDWANSKEIPMILETRDLKQYKKEIKLVKSLIK